MADYLEDPFVHDESDDVTNEVLDDEPRSIILSMLSQLTKGMDLHKVSFPTFVLEPRSMLERITDFMSHPQIISSSSMKDDAMERFIDIVRYFLSGWHVRPKGVKKPYNPILGEFFRCSWQLPDETTTFYISEQVSHHPPISAYFFSNPENNIVGMGNFNPKSKFLGNSIVSIMNGVSFMYFINRPGEEYVISNPNLYARGILFGKLLMELGDSARITCEASNLCCDINFKVKGYFSGEYNRISGKIKELSTGRTLYELSGKWTGDMWITSLDESPKSPEILFQATKTHIIPKIVSAIDEQEENESRNLWKNLTAAIHDCDHDRAAEEKNIIEDKQRDLEKMRSHNNIAWRPKFFRINEFGFWHFFDLNVLRENPQSLLHNIKELYNKHFTYTEN